MEFKFNPENLRVGRAPYFRGKYTFPEYSGFKPIIILTKGMGYDTLSPYYVKTKSCAIMENAWQFRKIYRVSPKHDEVNRHTGKVTWSQQNEVHVDENGSLTPQYFKWRERGFSHKVAVRYPPGRENMHLCEGAYLEGEDHILDYVEARSKIYATIYIQCIWNLPEFKELIELIKLGQKLLIIEVDGPNGGDLEYYKKEYKVEDDFIVNNTMIATPENIGIMLNDTKNKWGHCYAVAWAILIYFGCTNNLPILKFNKEF